VIVYKIRNKNNPGQFLKGTPTYHSWCKDGRIFPTLGKLRSFLTNSLKHDRVNVGIWEVVEIELVELSAKGVHEMIKPEQLIKILTK
jgi:hypothetical protein